MDVVVWQDPAAGEFGADVSGGGRGDGVGDGARAELAAAAVVDATCCVERKEELSVAAVEEERRVLVWLLLPGEEKKNMKYWVELNCFFLW